MTPESESGLVGGENRKWWTLAAVSFGLFMIMLDNTVVNVALPSIRADLGISVSELEWVVNAYALHSASLLLSGGKLADLLRPARDLHRRARDLHGRLALVRAGRRSRVADRRAHGAGRRRCADEPGDALDHHRDVPDAPARARRSGSGPASPRSRSRSARSSAACSPSGELELDLLHQRAGGRLGLVAARPSSTRRKDTSREQRLDLPGLVTSGVGLFALTYGLIETNTNAWGSTRVISLLALAGAALTAFVVLELRQRLPMLDLSLFRNAASAGQT